MRGEGAVEATTVITSPQKKICVASKCNRPVFSTHQLSSHNARLLAAGAVRFMDCTCSLLLFSQALQPTRFTVRPSRPVVHCSSSENAQRQAKACRVQSSHDDLIFVGMPRRRTPLWLCSCNQRQKKNKEEKKLRTHSAKYCLRR